ncbi:MAG: hypothetical protein ACRDMV_23915 [Streptosporangiales bacterium]
MSAWPGWIRRGPRLGPLPAPPTYPRTLLGPKDGVYGGTVVGATGQPVRSQKLGGRGGVRLALATEGVVLERRGTNDLLIDGQAMSGAYADGATLVLSWAHDGVGLETRVQLADTDDMQAWIEAVTNMKGHV